MQYYFDTSALIKHYHPEAGAAKVDAIFALSHVEIVISRLTMVEMTSACAKKVRVGKISQIEFHRSIRQFRRDALKGWRVVRIPVRLFNSAERMMRRIALQHNLRTLDAIQLCVALSLHSPASPITFVCADQALCAIAAAEGLAVINPEAP